MNKLVILWKEFIVAYFKVHGFRLYAQVKTQIFSEIISPAKIRVRIFTNQWMFAVMILIFL
jgi:hypothetical protein